MIGKEGEWKGEEGEEGSNGRGGCVRRAGGIGGRGPHYTTGHATIFIRFSEAA